MPDVFTKAKRSQVMSRIRSRGNKDTELALIRVFRAYHITGWRRNQPVFGKPDFIFPQLRLAVFVDGCFWHGCPHHATKPRNNAGFWRRKLSANQTRDLLVARTLRQSGWRVLRIWEHELRPNKRTRFMKRLRRSIDGAHAAATVSISTYDIQRAVADKAAVPLYYESRPDFQAQPERCRSWASSLRAKL